MSKEIRKQTEGEKKLSQLLGEYMEERKKAELALWLYGIRMLVGAVITFAGCVDNDREIFAMGVIAFCFGAVEFYLHKFK